MINWKAKHLSHRTQISINSINQTKSESKLYINNNSYLGFKSWSKAVPNQPSTNKNVNAVCS